MRSRRGARIGEIPLALIAFATWSFMRAAPCRQCGCHSERSEESVATRYGFLVAAAPRNDNCPGSSSPTYDCHSERSEESVATRYGFLVAAAPRNDNCPGSSSPTYDCHSEPA